MYWLITNYLRVEQGTLVIPQGIYSIYSIGLYIGTGSILPIEYLQYCWEHIVGILVPGTDIGYMQVMFMLAYDGCNQDDYLFTVKVSKWCLWL